MKKIREKGITLVALVITIVIIIILATITMNMVFGDNGLISGAELAKGLSDNSTIQEQADMNELSDEWSEMLSEMRGNKWQYDAEGNVTDGTVTLAIGDYVNYDCKILGAEYTSTSDKNGYDENDEDQTFTASSYEYGWRVLGVDEDTGEILLISERIVEPTSGGEYDSSYNITCYILSGQAGYTNGISELNAISAIYGQGEGATGARSITVEDINKITGYNPNNVGVYDPEQTGTGTKYGAGELYEYGNQVTYYWDGTYYPYYSAANGLEENLKTSHSNGFYWYDSASGWRSLAYTSAASTESRQEITTLESNGYSYYANTLTESESETTVGISTESTAYKMLFENSNSGTVYFLASSYVITDYDEANFGLYVAADGGVWRYYRLDLLGIG